jgi:hypothetical protein
VQRDRLAAHRQRAADGVQVDVEEVEFFGEAEILGQQR